MNILLIGYFFLLGIVFGSFFNVIGLRIKEKQLFQQKRSYCPHCHHQLTSKELIPILSFVIQQGKCKNCHKPISFLYPFIECMTGLLYAYSFIHIGFSMELLLCLLMISMFMIIIVTDLTYMLIPNKVLLFFLPFFVVLRVIVPLDPWWSPIAGALAGYGLLAIIIVSRGGMGAGDMKLLGVIGIIIGFPNVFLAFFLATFVGLLFSIPTLLVQKQSIKKEIPFGPAIIVGALLTYFYGESIIEWYWQLL